MLSSQVLSNEQALRLSMLLNVALAIALGLFIALWVDARQCVRSMRDNDEAFMKLLEKHAAGLKDAEEARRILP